MQLTMKGFKSRDQQLEIKGLTLVTGPNGSGKSAIADAVRFFALGFVPYLGKRPQDVAALMPDQIRELSVELNVNDSTGGFARRTLIRKEKGFELAATCSWLSEAKAQEQGKAITNLFGKEEVDVAEVLDLRELLNATPNQRAARLEALVSAGKRSHEEILLAVKRKIVQRLAEISDERMEKIADYKAALPMVGEKELGHLEETADLLASKIQDGGIAGAMPWANEGKRAASLGVKRREQAAEELRMRAVEIPEPDPREIKALEELRETLTHQIGALSNEAAGFKARAGRRESVLNAAAEASIALDRARAKAHQAIQDGAARIPAIRKELAGMGPEPVRPADPVDAGVRKLLQKADDLDAKASKIKTDDVPTTEEANQKVLDLEREIADLKASPWEGVRELGKRMKRAMGSKLESVKKWEPLIAELLKIVDANSSAERSLDLVDDELTEARKAAQGAEDAWKKAIAGNAARVKEQTDLRAQAREARGEARASGDKIRETYRQELRTWEIAHGEWVSKRSAGEAEISALDGETRSTKALQEAAEKRDASAKEVAEAAGPIEEAPKDPAPMVAQRNEAAAKLQKLADARAVHAEIQRNLAAIADARAEFNTFQAIEWALQQERQAELARSGGKFLEIVGHFLKSAGRPEVAFIKPGALVGWTRAGVDILVQAMSGAEWALFTAAVATAALQLRPASLRILLVEAGEMDGRTIGQLLAGIQAFKDSLTSAIVTTWSGIEEGTAKGFGFNLVNTSAAAEPVSASRG